MRRFALLLLAAILSTSCQKLLTTSFGSALASDVTVDKNASVSDLLSLATEYSGNRDVSEALYDAIQQQIADNGIDSLSVEDRVAVMSLAIATSDIESTMVETLQGIMTGTEDLSTLSDETISTMLIDLMDSSDTSITTTQLLSTLMSDPDTLAAASSETLILASALTAIAAVGTVVDTSTITPGQTFEDIAHTIGDTEVNATDGAREQFILAANVLQYAVNDGATPPTVIDPATATTADVLSSFTTSLGNLPDTLSSLFDVGA